MGDEKAFEMIYNRHHRSVYAYLLGLVKNPEIAEDLVHEVFMKLWIIRETLIVHTSVSSYIYRIAHNKAIDVLKQSATDRALRKKILDHLQPSVIALEYSSGQFEQYEALLEEALATLPSQRRKVFVLCRQQNKSYREAALEMGISYNTVKEHMAKALHSLRLFLQQRGVISLSSFLIAGFL